MARYRDKFGDTGYEYEHNFQNLRIFPHQRDELHLTYTSLVIDMVDDCNQSVESTCNPFLSLTNSNEFPNDNVENYLIHEIEQGLNGAKSWRHWRDNMESISNTTSGNIDELFANWY